MSHRSSGDDLDCIMCHMCLTVSKGSVLLTLTCVKIMYILPFIQLPSCRQSWGSYFMKVIYYILLKQYDSTV